MLTHDRAREAIGRSQGTDGDYPLISPSPDIQFLLADLLLLVEPQDPSNVPWSPPFSVKQLLGFGSGSGWQATIVDADDRTVFDTQVSDVDHTSAEYEERLRIHEWRSLTQGYLRIIEHTRRKADQPDITYDDNLQPTSAVINPEAVEFAPRAVNSFPVTSSIVNTRNQRLVLQSGNNFQFVATPPTPGVVGDPTRIQLVARRGVGLGDARCTATDLALTSLGGARPGRDGAVIVSPGASGCLAIAHPGELVDTSGGSGLTFAYRRLGPAQLKLINQCDPCPDCNDYVNVKTAIDGLYWKIANMGGKVASIRDRYVLENDHWLAEKERQEEELFFAFKTTSLANGSTCVQFKLKVPHTEQSLPVSVGFDIELGPEGSTSGGWEIVYGTFMRTYSSWSPENMALAQDSHIAIPGVIEFDAVYPERNAEFQFCVAPTAPIVGSGDIPVICTVTVNMPGKPIKTRKSVTYTYVS